MKLAQNFTKLVLDIETTGTRRDVDQVIQLAMTLEKGEARRKYNFRVKPSRRISPGASAVHGIIDADLAGEKSFCFIADFVYRRALAAQVIIGYNVDFDCDILAAELKRCGYADPFEGKLKIDGYKLWLSE